MSKRREKKFFFHGIYIQDIHIIMILVLENKIFQTMETDFLCH